MTAKRQKQSPNPIPRNPFSTNNLLPKILSKLPIKPLLRFKTVNKHWFSLISSHSFCLLRNPTPNPASAIFLSIKDDKTYQYRYISLYGNCFRPLFSLDFTTCPSKTEIMHSCNGFLLCCSSVSWDNVLHTVLSRPDCKMYVYNPTTSSFATIPDFPIGIRLGAALVFDPVKSPHYKLVLVVLYPNVMVEGSTSRTNVCGFQVYSSETRCWSSGGEREFDWRSVNFGNGVYWNGSVHWLNKKLSKNNSVIALRFNVETLVLKKMRTPHVVRERNYWEKYYFGESCDHLHFAEPMLPRFIVYEMKRDYSEWFVKYRVDLTQFVSDHDVFNNAFCDKYEYDVCVFSLVRDESGDGAKLVLRIPFAVVMYNLVDGISETLCDHLADRVYGTDDCCDGKYGYADERGLDYIQTLCNVL